MVFKVMYMRLKNLLYIKSDLINLADILPFDANSGKLKVTLIIIEQVW